MPDTAKIFRNGASQAVRLPVAYRFDVDEVFIRKDSTTGEVILSPRPTTWDGYLATLKNADFPDDFMRPADRNQGEHKPDPLEGWDP